VLPPGLTASTLPRLVRRILLIPSWEANSADPEEKRGPCERHPQTPIDRRTSEVLDTERPNREASQCGLCDTVSGYVRTADILEEYNRIACVSSVAALETMPRTKVGVFRSSTFPFNLRPIRGHFPGDDDLLGGTIF
jgi:hypothetical protein